MGGLFPEWLGRRRRALDEDLTRRGLAHTFSLARFLLHQQTEISLRNHARGACLDIGSGRSPFKTLLETRCTAVTSVDVEQRSEHVDLVADVQDLSALQSDSFETVLCTQVLEHVPRPRDAAREIARVLAPEGRLILSVPHLSAIHEAPNDFHRFTPFGLQELCRASGLNRSL